MIRAPWTLRRDGVLGINARNHRLIQALNPRARYPLVDDKRLTKRALQKWGIPTPPEVAVLEHHGQLANFRSLIGERERFVCKPCNGAGGKGILVITHRSRGAFFKASGQELSLPRISAHLANILAGLYSLGGRPDAALVEDCIFFSDAFQRFALGGVPDVRIIVYRGYPMMAMMRLPTRDSDGKANLHQGAVGVGIDLAQGRATSAFYHDRPVQRHPDTGADLAELSVPHWTECLVMAARCYDLSGMGYLGTDLVIDAERGPVILELNARPGLSIQLANQCGIRSRVKALEDIARDPLPPAEERVRRVQNRFADHRGASDKEEGTHRGS